LPGYSEISKARYTDEYDPVTLSLIYFGEEVKTT